MHTLDVQNQIVCPVCGHSVRCDEDEGGRIAWCGWCGTVAILQTSTAFPDGVADALIESAQHQLLARALLHQSRQLKQQNARIRAMRTRRDAADSGAPIPEDDD
jgi:hypothetical protein